MLPKLENGRKHCKRSKEFQRHIAGHHLGCTQIFCIILLEHHGIYLEKTSMCVTLGMKSCGIYCWGWLTWTWNGKRLQSHVGGTKLPQNTTSTVATWNIALPGKVRDPIWTCFAAIPDNQFLKSDIGNKICCSRSESLRSIPAQLSFFETLHMWEAAIDTEI